MGIMVRTAWYSVCTICCYWEIGDSGIYIGRALWLGFDIAEYEWLQTPLTLIQLQNKLIDTYVASTPCALKQRQLAPVGSQYHINLMDCYVVRSH